MIAPHAKSIYRSLSKPYPWRKNRARPAKAPIVQLGSVGIARVAKNTPWTFIAGSLVCTQLIDRKVARPIVILIGAYFIGAAAVFSIGYAGTAFWTIMITIFLSGFFIIGVQLSLNAYITNYYPTAIRGTGIGWSQVAGRLGSLLGPLAGGVLVSQGTLPSRLFQISAVAPLLACVSLIVFANLSREPDARR